ncbi:MAG TPA: helix-turn-helix domain-containing protein [Chloroflexota bacterium]|nr:helix-turn-helix domain-containing protein [Chloroflexota bacterium]HEX2987169.1 helix-turn-helix domain-containing protein [Chloroflexota bacterium]
MIEEEHAMERMMTVKEVAAYLKLNPITVYRYAAQGKIPGFKVGSSWRFKKEILDEWVINEAKRYSGTTV